MTGRIFLALTLPPVVRAALALVQKSLRERGVDAGWEDEEKLHVTVRFLGETTDEQLHDVGQRVSDLALSLSAFDIVISGLGAFPTPAAPRVLWAGVFASDAVVSLMRRAEEACRAAGFEPEHRDPHPHCTLARIKRHDTSRSLTPILNSVTFDPILTRSSELSVMKSVHHQGGTRYTRLSSHPFNRTRGPHD